MVSKNLSVCLWSILNPIISGVAEHNGLKMLQETNYIQKIDSSFIPPGSEASREVANLTERKNPHTLVYGVKEFVCLSVCLLQCVPPQKMVKLVSSDLI